MILKLRVLWARLGKTLQQRKEPMPYSDHRLALMYTFHEIGGYLSHCKQVCEHLKREKGILKYK